MPYVKIDYQDGNYTLTKIAAESSTLSYVRFVPEGIFAAYQSLRNQHEVFQALIHSWENEK